MPEDTARPTNCPTCYGRPRSECPDCGSRPEDTARPDRLRITVSDVATGEVLSETVIFDDYLLICAGHPYLANTQAHANGTHVLTVKNAGPWRSHHAARNREASDA